MRQLSTEERDKFKNAKLNEYQQQLFDTVMAYLTKQAPIHTKSKKVMPVKRVQKKKTNKKLTMQEKKAMLTQKAIAPLRLIHGTHISMYVNVYVYITGSHNHFIEFDMCRWTWMWQNVFC